MRTSTDTLLRQWVMLREIPRQPGRKTTTAIVRALEREGHPVTPRTVQRDLERLSTVFPFTCEAEGRVNHWYWPSDAKVIDIPALAPSTALAFTLARDHLRPLLPPATLRLLEPYFARAEQVLGEAPRRPLARWRDKVRVISRGPALATPRVDTAAQAAIYDALLDDRRLAMRYRRRSDDEVLDYEVSPLGLVAREGVLYLVAAPWEYDDVLQFALHRVRKATVLDKPARRPAGFDLGRYVEQQKEFAYPTGRGIIRLRLKMDARVAEHLEERPLSDDQKVRELPHGRKALTASVLDTEELRWWLLGFGDAVEVVAPKRLRAELSTILRGTLRHYVAAQS